MNLMLYGLCHSLGGKTFVLNDTYVIIAMIGSTPSRVTALEPWGSLALMY
jgi:hypothetical protein